MTFHRSCRTGGFFWKLEKTPRDFCTKDPYYSGIVFPMVRQPSSVEADLGTFGDDVESEAFRRCMSLGSEVLM